MFLTEPGDGVACDKIVGLAWGEVCQFNDVYIPLHEGIQPGNGVGSAGAGKGIGGGIAGSRYGVVADTAEGSGLRGLVVDGDRRAGVTLPGEVGVERRRVGA